MSPLVQVHRDAARLGYIEELLLLLLAGRRARARGQRLRPLQRRSQSDPAPDRTGRVHRGAARAIADHARHAGVTPRCRVIADAERLRHCTLRQIAEELDKRVRLPGRLSGELNHSGYERLGRRLLSRSGVAVASRPGPIVHRERVVAEVDLPFFDVRYAWRSTGRRTCGWRKPPRTRRATVCCAATAGGRSTASGGSSWSRTRSGSPVR